MILEKLMEPIVFARLKSNKNNINIDPLKKMIYSMYQKKKKTFISYDT